MSRDLANELDRYGEWIEQRCSVQLRRHEIVQTNPTDTGSARPVQVVVLPATDGRQIRHVAVFAAAVLLLGAISVGLWSLRRADVQPSALPEDPSGALFLLPASTDGMTLTRGRSWTTQRGSDYPLAQVNVVWVGRPDGDGFVDIVSISDPVERPTLGLAPWTRIDTVAGPEFKSSNGRYAWFAQRTGDRWITLAGSPTDEDASALLAATSRSAVGVEFVAVDGFVEIGRFTDVAGMFHSTEYVVAQEGAPTLTVSTTTSISPFLGLPPSRLERATVQGHPGWKVTGTLSGANGIIWQVTPHRIATVSGQQASDHALHALAEALEMVDESTWLAALNIAVDRPDGA